MYNLNEMTKESSIERRNNLLSFIVNFTNEREYPPSMLDIEDHTGVRRGHVLNTDLELLQKEGFIERDSGKSRAMKVTMYPWPFTYDEKYREFKEPPTSEE